MDAAGVTTVVISQPMFFPWVGMFEQIALADVYVHYDDVQYSKGSFTNRVQIKTATGREWLTVPLQGGRLGQSISEIAAAPGPWRDQHLDRLRRSYGEALSYELMERHASRLYEGYSEPLADWLISSLEALATTLTSSLPQFERSSDLGIGGASWQRVLDVVRHFGGDTYVTGHGARNYLDEQAFENAGIEVRYMDYACTPYPQLHGGFTPYVSVLDLLANVGEDAGQFISPQTVNWREFTT